MKDQFIFGVAWFKPEQWKALKYTSVDGDELEETRSEGAKRIARERHDGRTG